MDLTTHFRKAKQRAEDDLKFALTAPGFRLCQITTGGEIDITAQHIAQLRTVVAEYEEAIKMLTKP